MDMARLKKSSESNLVPISHVARSTVREYRSPYCGQIKNAMPMPVAIAKLIMVSSMFMAKMLLVAPGARSIVACIAIPQIRPGMYFATCDSRNEPVIILLGGYFGDLLDSNSVKTIAIPMLASVSAEIASASCRQFVVEIIVDI